MFEKRKNIRCGVLAKEFGYSLPLAVLESPNGFYIGTFDDSGPVSRESEEYYTTFEQADSALKHHNFTQMTTLFD